MRASQRLVARLPPWLRRAYLKVNPRHRRRMLAAAAFSLGFSEGFKEAERLAFAEAARRATPPPRLPARAPLTPHEITAITGTGWASDGYDPRRDGIRH